MVRSILFAGAMTALVLAGFSFRETKTGIDLTSNEYKVLTVQGRIIFESSGKDMQRGDLYVTGTPLNFMTSSSRAAIINDVNGRFVLSSGKGKLRVLPAANNISSRSGGLLNIVDLKNHFEGRYLVIKRSEVQIGYESFPMDEERFFYLVYDHEGESIAKKLRFEGDRLILDAAEIFKIDGNPIPVTEKEMTLYYKGEKTYRINTFTPVFPDPDELKAEVKILVETLGRKPAEEISGEVVAHLTEFYGRPYEENVNAWLKAEFDLEP